MITFSELFLKQYVHENILDEFPFLITEVAPPNYPNREVFQMYDSLGDQLFKEYGSDSDYKFKVIDSLMVVLLLRIKERFWQAYDPLIETSANSAIVLTFKRSTYIPVISVPLSNAKLANPSAVGLQKKRSLRLRHCWHDHRNQCKKFLFDWGSRIPLTSLASLKSILICLLRDLGKAYQTSVH